MGWRGALPPLGRCMRIAVLTDVHANLTALRAVLADIRAHGPFHLIVSGGDQLCGGPRPLETWDELESAGVTMLKGDTERDLALGSFKPVPGRGLRRDLILSVFDWTLQLVPPGLRERVAALPEQLRLRVDGGPELLLAHANGVNLDDFIWADTPPDDLERLIGPNPPALMVVGHIHAPLELEFNGATILRPGSVGAEVRTPLGRRGPLGRRLVGLATRGLGLSAAPGRLGPPAGDRRRTRRGLSRRTHPAGLRRRLTGPETTPGPRKAAPPG